ncbi:MAG: hypothetical protein DMG58_31705 [Acidobacteria bacterium]|nr:MAG: hypothetical protein DMG58_31705 [Acidobacteriota bacterium]
MHDRYQAFLGFLGMVRTKVGFWRTLSALCLVCLFVLIMVRAGTQSITADEALNYNSFLRDSIGQVFTSHYDANNHVLHTALCWLSIYFFGLTEFTFRIPTLVGSILFFYAIFQLASILFERQFFHLIATIALAGNPYVIDFFTVARGYGLALAFLALALLAALRTVGSDEVGRTHLFHAGLWSSLSVISNLAFLFPATGLLIALMLVLLRFPGQQKRPVIALAVIDSAWGPFLVLSFLVLVMPLLTATPDSFLFGAKRWHETIASLVTGSFFHNLEIPLLCSWPAFFWYVCDKTTATYVPALAGTIFVAALVLLFRPGSRQNFVPLLVSLAFSLTVALVWLVHSLAHVKLPVMRTGIYFLFLFPLALLSFLAGERKSLTRRLGWVFLPVVVFLVLLYVPQSNRYDASTRKFTEAIELVRNYTASPNVRVGGSWLFKEALNFYRLKNHYDHWQPIVRQKAMDPADFYVLANTDREAVKALNLRVLFDDPVSQSILAVPMPIPPAEAK